MREKLELFKKWLYSLSSPLIAGIISIVCGLMLAIFGLGAFDILIWIVGIVVIIAGAFRLYLRISLYRNGTIGSIGIIADCIPIIVGILLMVFKTGVLSSLINLIAIAICVWSIYRLAKLFIYSRNNRTREFWYEVVTSCILICVVIVILIFSGIAERLCGIMLVLSGIELLRSALYLKSTKKNENIYDAEFRDVTNQKDDGKNN